MSVVRRVTSMLPLDLAIAGRKRNAIFKVLDPLLRGTTQDAFISTQWGQLGLDNSHPPERFLAYLFDNILRYYEKSELGRYIVRMAEPGATFIDIGANLGLYALVARRAGFDTIVVEPEPRHSAFLERNAHVFGQVLPMAFSDCAGALPLYYEADNPGATSLFPSPSYIRGEGTVPVRTFSEVAAGGDIGDLSKIRLVKIDVEGFETQVVAGMGDALRSGWRPHIWCEVRGDGSGRNGGSYRKVREDLAGFGYVAHELKDGCDVALNEIDLARRSVFDLLFTPMADRPLGE